MKTTHIVKSSSACMPGSCWGVYRRVAVLEVNVVDGEPVNPTMISSRARGVVRVVATWERLNVGTTNRCAYRVAMSAAENMAGQLNGRS